MSNFSIKSFLTRALSVSAGSFVVKNLDGDEKRFPSDSSPAAQAWKKSRSTKNPKYTTEWWENQPDVDVLPWSKIEYRRLDANDLKPVFKDAGFNTVDDFTAEGFSSMKDGSVTVATMELRVIEKGEQEGVWILVKRDFKDPNKLKFVKYLG